MCCLNAIATGAFETGPDQAAGPKETSSGEASENAPFINLPGSLTVSEPGKLMNGAFSLASPLEVSFGPAAWSGPVSNAPVAIAFKQHIGAGEALRTGAYNTTLTWTLSTTNP